MNRKKALGWVAAVLIVGGFALLGFSQSRYQSEFSRNDLINAMQGDAGAASEMSARLEAFGSTQTLFGTTYVMLLAGAGAAITAVALRREP